MNQKNLKPFDTWSPDDHRAASVKGGIASGKARRKKAALLELATLAMYRIQADEYLEKMRQKEQRRRRKNKLTADPDG